MSVSLVLIPAIIAAATGASALGAAGALSTALGGGGAPSALQVSTRMRDASLLVSALSDLGAAVLPLDENRIDARIDDLLLELARTADGIWVAHVDSAIRQVTVDEANSLMLALDGAYARRVQSAVIERVRERAPGAGFTLVSEQRDDDDSVTMVLTVNGGGA